MNWKRITLTRPARAIKPAKEKSGLPSENPAFVAASIMSLAEVPSLGKAAFMAFGSIEKAPKKLMATQIIAKMESPVTTLWKVRVRSVATAAITSMTIIPVMILLVLSWNQFWALPKKLFG